MSRILPPPPDPRDNRAFRDWLYKVYAVINGLDPSANMTGEDSLLSLALPSLLSLREWRQMRKCWRCGLMLTGFGLMSTG